MLYFESDDFKEASLVPREAPPRFGGWLVSDAPGCARRQEARDRDVGLPARAELHRAAHRALPVWLGYATRVFNVAIPQARGRRQHAAPFFDPTIRRRAAAPPGRAARARRHDRVAAAEGTSRSTTPHSSRSRRAQVASTARRRLQVLFVSSCATTAVIEANTAARSSARRTTRTSTPTKRRRLPRTHRHYERVYEPLEDDEGAFARMENRPQQQVHHIDATCSRLVSSDTCT